MAGGILVSGAAYVLLLASPDLVRLPDASWQVDPATDGPVPVPKKLGTATLLRTQICALKLS